jgi:hypothetical protein
MSQAKRPARRRRQAEFLADLFFDLTLYPEDGNDTMLQNVGCFHVTIGVISQQTDVFSK